MHGATIKKKNLCCLLLYSFQGSGFDFLFQDTSGLRTANLIVYRTAPQHSRPTHTYSETRAGWAFKVDMVRPFMITNYFLNYFQTQGQTSTHTTAPVRLAKVVNQLITFTFKFVTLTLKKYNNIVDNYILEIHLFSTHEHNTYMVIFSDLWLCEYSCLAKQDA